MRLHPAGIIAAIIVALEGIAVLALAVTQVIAMTAGDTAEIATAIALLVLTIVMGVGMLAFAWGILRGETWGRSGGIVTQVLVFAVGLGAATGGYAHPGIGFMIMVPAIAGFAAIILAARQRPDQRHADGADGAQD